MLTVKSHIVNGKRKVFARASVSVMLITFSLSAARQITKLRKLGLFGSYTGQSSIRQDSDFLRYNTHAVQ